MTHYFTLRALSAELYAALRGLRITGAFTQKKDELLVIFGNGTTLCISVDPQCNYCFLKEGTARARRNTVDLFPSIVDAVVLGVATVPYDRTIVIDLEDGSRLLCRLYGTATSNIVLSDANGTITDAFKNREGLLSSTASPGRSVDETMLRDLRVFGNALRAGKARSLAGALKHALPFLGRLYVSEVLTRSGVPATADIDELTPDVAGKILGAVTALIAAAPSPRLYHGDVEVFSVVPLLHLGAAPWRGFESVNDAMRTLVSASGRTKDLSGKKDFLSHKLADELDRHRRSLRAVENELLEAGRAETYEHHGKLLMAQLSLARKGMKQVDLEDVFGAGERIRITLNPALSPVQNAEHLFSKARKARASRIEAEQRRKLLEQHERLLAELHRECEGCNSVEEIAAFQERHKTTLRKMKIMSAAQEEEAPPFRIFTIAGGYDVWVGKSSSNNDLLTMKYAKPHDLWFHARGASGSHTVLKVRDKSTTIPKEAVREAARIAAYYSKMRNAKTVPVAYCERKYVRKPKGAPPGTVVLEREEVIFVDPKLPAPAP